MADIPTPTLHKPTITTASIESVGIQSETQGGFNWASAVWRGAGTAIFVPFALRSPYQVTRVFWCNGATVGNGTADLGIYETKGAVRLASTGPITTAGASVPQVTALALRLLPGSYYMALSLSSTSDTQLSNNLGDRYLRSMGMASQASVSTLPAVATLVTTAQDWITLFGISSATVV